MTGQVIFLTHANVVVDPNVPVPDWALNETGRARHESFASDSVLDGVTSIFCSTERKATDAAEITARARDLNPIQRAEFGENDRSSTGYLPEDAFWPVVDAFFAQPETSVKGWERAVDAQSRVVSATQAASSEAPEGDVLVIAHGGVATLLRCHLLKKDISKDEGQIHPKGGCWFAFDRDMTKAPTPWRAI